MEHYGLGVIEVLYIFELILQPKETLQSPHSQEEPTGNKFLVELFIQQQSRLMEPYGLGEVILMDD